MPLSPAQRTLLDSAAAEAKRAGHEAVSVLHLATVLARREPKLFAERFGPDAAARLREQLRRPPGPDTRGAQEFLESVQTSDEAKMIAALEGSLPLADDDTPEPEPAARPSAPEPAPRVEQSSVRSHLLELVDADENIRGRETVAAELVALLGRQVPATPLLVGPAGGGNTAAVRALAALLAAEGYAGPLAGAPVVRVRASSVLKQNPVSGLARALDEAPDDAVVVVDDVEVLTGLGGGGVIAAALTRLRAAVEDPATRLILIVEERYAARLDAADEEMASEVTRVAVPPLGIHDLHEIAVAVSARLAEHHSVKLPEDIARQALAPAGPNEARAHPGLLIDRLDTACARAALRAEREVAAADLALSAEVASTAAAVEGLAERLRARVSGQDDAIERISRRLALTRAQLDLRPERPDGVFLFVGPTGVGKTELARAVCAELFGDEQRLVRLDMSEYAHDWALSRLTGPQPGYVGFTEPESWLTTRVRKQPDTVLLLDEIEKAHPTVWNAFLQVFDAGRLSDARGNVADFSRTVVALTSNLGAHAFSAPKLGFARGEESAPEERVIDQIRSVMPPELINRLDDIIVFWPLTPDTIREIAFKEARAALTRLAALGYRVTLDDGVIELLAQTGYDPRYGARHLHRNVESMLLQPIATLRDRDLRAQVTDGAIVVLPA